MQSSKELHQLLQLADGFHIPDPREAYGRCFAATLGLADLADQHGYALQLIRWQVLGDPDFCDHWAVLFKEKIVIDLTRVQVDGKTEVTHGLGTYPANYCRPRCYSPDVLLPNFRRLTDSRLARLPFWFMWDCGVALARHDMRTALKSRKLWQFAIVIAEAVKFSWRSLLIGLNYHLVRQPQSRIWHDTVV
jgi:hypothetical protein